MKPDFVSAAMNEFGESESLFVRVTDLQEVTETENRALDSVAVEPFIQKGNQAKEKRELTARAWGPLFQLLESDEKAVEAIGRLGLQAQGRPIDPPSGRRDLPWRGHDLRPGWDLFFPPFDIGQPASSKPRGTGHSWVYADRGIVDVMSSSDDPGVEIVTGRVGMQFISKKVGVVDVRPLVIVGDSLGNWAWSSEDGFVLDAWCTGDVVLAATRDGGIVDTRSTNVLRSHSQTDDYQWFGGPTDPLETYLQFGVEPDAVYTVWIAATVAGDQSGYRGPFEGHSYFRGSLPLRVPWLQVRVH